LKHLEHRYPIDAGGLHGDRLDSYRDEPDSHPFNVTGERLKRLHRVFAQLQRHADYMNPRADVDSCSTVMDDWQTGWLVDAF
jgi:hypothetical protein